MPTNLFHSSCFDVHFADKHAFTRFSSPLCVQLLLLIERYVSQTNSVDSGFQSSFGVTIFIDTGNHSL